MEVKREVLKNLKDSYKTSIELVDLTYGEELDQAHLERARSSVYGALFRLIKWGQVEIVDYKVVDHHKVKVYGLTDLGKAAVC